MTARSKTTKWIQAGVVEVFARTSPVLQYLPFQNVAGNAYQFNREETLPGVAFRDYNQPYDESTGVVQREVEVRRPPWILPNIFSMVTLPQTLAPSMAWKPG